MSRDTSVFKFVKEEHTVVMTDLIKILHHNRNYDGVYAKARQSQKEQVLTWFGDK